MTGEHEGHHEPGQRGTGRHEPAQLNRPQHLPVIDREARIEARHAHREQQEQRDDVQGALQDDRGERGGRVEALRAREQVRTNHFTDAAGQHGIGAEADHRGTACRPERYMPARQEQVLPADGAEYVRGHRGDERQDDPNGSGL